MLDILLKNTYKANWKRKIDREYNYAVNAQTIYSEFTMFLQGVTQD